MKRSSVASERSRLAPASGSFVTASVAARICRRFTGRSAPLPYPSRERREVGMIRTGDEYRAGLRDGREVWIDGERVKDVTIHPAFKPVVDHKARMYDMGARGGLGRHR